MSLTGTEEIKSLNNIFLQIIKQNLTGEALEWLLTKAELIRIEEKPMQLNLAFSQLPRFVHKNPLVLEEKAKLEITERLPGLSIEHWTTDRLSRVWLLINVPDQQQENYSKKINGLFAAAEMNEQVALYSALPLYAYPEQWIPRCEEGIRSNIGTVLEAIMYHNPYPAKFLTEASWNQLVLKAFFTEKDVNKITGIHERLNKALSETLQDYTQERLAAHRSVLPEIYELIELTNQKI